MNMFAAVIIILLVEGEDTVYEPLPLFPAAPTKTMFGLASMMLLTATDIIAVAVF